MIWARKGKYNIRVNESVKEQIGMRKRKPGFDCSTNLNKHKQVTTWDNLMFTKSCVTTILSNSVHEILWINSES